MDFGSNVSTHLYYTSLIFISKFYKRSRARLTDGVSVSSPPPPFRTPPPRTSSGSRRRGRRSRGSCRSGWTGQYHHHYHHHYRYLDGLLTWSNTVPSPHTKLYLSMRSKFPSLLYTGLQMWKTWKLECL